MTEPGKVKRGKGKNAKVRKYNLLTFSEDEAASISSDTGTLGDTRPQDDKVKSGKGDLDNISGKEAVDKTHEDTDSISEISVKSTEKATRKQKHRKEVNAVTNTENNKNAIDKRKDYSERQNSSLCEKILAVKRNKLAHVEFKSDQNESEQVHEADNDTSNTNDDEVKKKNQKKINDKLKIDKFSIDRRSKEDNDIEGITDSDVNEEDNNVEEIQQYQSNFENEPIPLEKQVKFCQERVTHIEKNYGAFCETLGSVTRKIARLRDKGDLLAKQVVEYADKEKVSVSTTKNLKDFAHNLAAIQDYRDAEIHRLDTKVVKPLSAYGPKCKKIKQIIKTEQSAINREIKQRKNLEKVRDKKPGDAHSISAAETELQKAAADAAIGGQGLQNQMAVFEKDKLTDLKKILADFVSVEMVFHAKAIEYYSQCFENLAMIDEEEDLHEFSRKLNLSQSPGPDTLGSSLPPGMTVPQGTITSLGSTVRSSTMETTGTSEYTSTGESYTYTYGDSTTSSTGEKRVRIQNQSMYADVDDEYDDDDDDDDDYDDDNPQIYSRPVKQR